MTKMRIVFLSRYQNRVNRGAEAFVFELVKRLSKNHQVEIFAGSDADDISKVIKGGYDVVVPINGRMQSLKASLGRGLGRYRLLISGHSGIGRDDIWNIVIVRPDVFVALTNQMARWAKSWAWGVKVAEIPNGIDLSKFKPEGEKINLELPRPIILSVGALTWYKHHERIINAMSQMSKGSLLIVGRGEERKELEKMGRKLLDNRFAIMDFTYEDMPKVYRSCDLFSLPSWDREAFGIVYLEALATGLGVVAPNDSSRREIIGDGGLFTDVSNSAKYAEVIEQALDLDWAKKARSQAEKFSWDIIADQYEKLMLNLIKKS